MAQNQTIHFGTTDDGKHIACSSSSPYFCFIGATEAEVEDKARRALNFYHQSTGHLIPENQVGKTPSQTVLKRVFKSREIDSSELCLA